MVSVMVALVLFLLPSFHASGECTCGPRRDVQVPRARNVAPLEPAPIITLTHQGVRFDGRRVGTVAEFCADGRTPGRDAIAQELDTLRRNYAILHPGMRFPGAVLIEAERDLDFALVRRVVDVARDAGYPNTGFVVQAQPR